MSQTDDRFKTCRFKGCKRIPTDRSIVFQIRASGREGRRAGGLEKSVTAVVCERHANVLLNRLLNALEKPTPNHEQIVREIKSMTLAG